jgi:hypothetical protein
MKFEKFVAAACSSAALMFGGAASATGYFESISADPSSFTCSISNGLQTCGGYTFFQANQPAGAIGHYNGGSGILSVNPGDVITVDVSYTSTLDVPDSKTISLVYVDLFALNAAGKFAYLPNKTANVSSVLVNYSGPSNPYFSYQSANYSASAGHYFGAGNPGGFSIDGIDSTFGLVQATSDYIILAAYGYQAAVPEPATWAMMLFGFGSLGMALRRRRRSAAA